MRSDFKIGSRNNTVQLTPSINLDFTAVSAKNCTRCQYKNYDTFNSMGDNFLKGSDVNQSIETGVKESEYSILLNGSFVTDTFAAVNTNKMYSNKTSEVYKFFLIHSISTGEKTQTYTNALGDGYIGMSSNLGSN